MEGLNRVQLVGNLGGDPELKMTANGQPLLKFNIATSESYRDKNEVLQERKEWHRIVVFGKSAEGLAKFVRKGWRVYVEGRIEHSTYEKDGQKHFSTDIVALKVLALAAPREKSVSEPTFPAAPLSMSNGAPHAAQPSAIEIPF